MTDLVDTLEIPTLTKAGLADQLVAQLGINGREAIEMVDSFFGLVLERLQRGEDVKLAGFGSFNVQRKAARPGRNPKTGADVVISPRQVVKFSQGPKLRERMASGALRPRGQANGPARAKPPASRRVAASALPNPFSAS